MKKRDLLGSTAIGPGGGFGMKATGQKMPMGGRDEEGRPHFPDTQRGAFARLSRHRLVREDEKLDLERLTLERGGKPPKFIVKKKPSGFLHDMIMEQDAHPVRPYRKMKIKKSGIERFTRYFHRMALDVRLAERVILDEKALETIITVSNTSDVRKVEGMLMLANLPHERMYVEFDAGLRRRINRANGTLVESEDVDPDGRAAFLLRRVKPEDASQWTAMYLVQQPDYVDFGGLGLLVETEGRGLPLIGYPTAAVRYHEMGLIHAKKDPNWHRIPWGIIPDEGVSMERLADSARVLIPAITYALMDDEEVSLHNLERNLYSSQGDLRFLCAFLAMMNTVPVTKIARPDTPPRRFIGTRHITYHGHSVVSVDLNRTQAVETLFKLGYKREAPINHPVRASWPRVKGAVIGCGPRMEDHETWVPTDKPKHARCPKCGQERHWRRDHRRGDAAKKGYIESRETKVTAKGKR